MALQQVCSVCESIGGDVTKHHNSVLISLPLITLGCTRHISPLSLPGEPSACLWNCILVRISAIARRVISGFHGDVFKVDIQTVLVSVSNIPIDTIQRKPTFEAIFVGIPPCLWENIYIFALHWRYMHIALFLYPFFRTFSTFFATAHRGGRHLFICVDESWSFTSRCATADKPTL